MSGAAPWCSNSEFVGRLCRRLLGRRPRRDERRVWLRALRRGEMSREDLVALFTSLKHSRLHASSEFVPSGHFYSAVPSVADREVALQRPRQDDDDVLGISMSEAAQEELLTRLIPHFKRCPYPRTATRGFLYYFENPAYSYADALTLFAMIGEFKPKRIIEIGSGFSSCAMLDASDRCFAGEIELTFIDPYPQLLESLAGRSRIAASVIGERLQDVDLTVFDQLRPADMLFIDSTHVTKLGSDVNRIFFDILPRVAPGVLVHLHDVFWPFEYPPAWIEEGRAWNEAYLLRAFLQFNSEFEVLLFSDFMFRRHREWLEAECPDYAKMPGGNIWLRRRVRLNSSDEGRTF